MEVETSEQELKRDFEMVDLKESLESFGFDSPRHDSTAGNKRGRFVHPNFVQIKTVSGTTIRMEFSLPAISIREIKYLLAMDYGMVDFRLMAKPTEQQGERKYVPVTNMDDLAVESGSVLYLVFSLACRGGGSAED